MCPPPQLLFATPLEQPKRDYFCSNLDSAKNDPKKNLGNVTLTRANVILSRHGRGATFLIHCDIAC